nr:Chain C, Beta-theraphotoxin-Cm1a [Ceratogyrus marshalli]5EPM_D Chain D, Beta-theraphotoxin-Cm1a [Ceratogyrus marshalli]
DCLGMFKSCDPENDKCCKRLVCSRSHRWCKWKL